MADADYDICTIGGLGHIGLPLSLAFADAGKKVICFDTNEETAAQVIAGRMPFREEGAAEILARVLNRTLFVTLEPGCLARSHFLIVVIGTPVDRHLNPQFTLFRRFFEDLLPHIRDHHHIILCSTVYPGTTTKIRSYLAAQGKRPRVSFCPERVAQGKALIEHRSLPQIVSSFDKDSEEEASALFRLLTKDVLVLEPVAAELAKLFSNTWRYIQFAIANQFYQIATENGIDFYQVHAAVTYNYPRLADLPGAGFTAGPCLFKDTMQLASFANNGFFLGHAAMLINEGLPNFIVRMLKARYDLREKTVGILGMAFKAEIDDGRDSLAYKLRKILEVEARQVVCSDEYIRNPDFVSAQELVGACDVIIIGAPHKAYATLDFSPGKDVVDVWNYFGRGGWI